LFRDNKNNATSQNKDPRIMVEMSRTTSCRPVRSRSRFAQTDSRLAVEEGPD